MIARVISATGIACLTLFAVAVWASDPAGAKQLQRAIDLLERNELSKVVPMLEELARTTDTDLAARALLTLGNARQRQGNDSEARAVYANLVAQYPRHDAAAEAKTRLAKLAGPIVGDSPASHRVVAGEDADPWAFITPDGRFLSRADRHTGDVIVRDLTMARSTPLLAKRDTFEASQDHAELPMISPDGSRVVYVWVFRDDKNQTQYQLRVMPRQPGAPSRVLVDSAAVRTADALYCYFEPIGWSQDGQTVFVTAWKTNGTSQLARVSLDGSGLKVLKNLGDRLGRGRPRLSPDGQFLAYSAVPPTVAPADVPLARFQGPLHLFMLPLNASGETRETELVRGASVNESPVWTPDGRHLLFVSNRSGEGFGLWSLALENGQGSREQRIRANVSGRIQPVGMTKAGTMYYVPERLTGTGMDVFVADVDERSGRVRGRATPLLDSVVDRSIAPSWSPDGDRIAFKRRRPSSTVPRVLEPVEVVIYSHVTGKEEVAVPFEGLDDTPALWLDNKRFLLVRHVNGRLFRLDAERRRFATLESVAHSALPPECGSHALSPDGKTLFLSVLDPRPRPAPGTPLQAPNRRIVAFDVTTGDQRNVLAPRPITALAVLAVSPDGRSLAAALQQEAWKTPRLALVDVQTGSVQDVPTVTLPRAVSWTRAGLLVARDGERRTEIVKVTPHDGAVVPTGLAYARGQFFDVRADGERVVFSDRTRTDEDELWAYRNLLSYLKPVQ